MFKQIKVMLDEARKLTEAEAAANTPIVSDNPKANFDELVKLSEIKNSRFKITGDARQFEIICKPDYFILLLWAVFIFYVPVRSIIEQSFDSTNLIVMFVLLGIMFFYFKYANTTYNILVDSHQKQLLLKSSNPLGKILRPEAVIEFRDFTDFSTKTIYTKMKGTTREYCKVYIHFRNEKMPLIYLPAEPLNFIDHKIFVNNLKSFIKHSV
jgi:hypothetical protein